MEHEYESEREPRSILQVPLHMCAYVTNLANMIYAINALMGDAAWRITFIHHFTECFNFLVQSVPIRLTQTPTICSGANDKLQGSWFEGIVASESRVVQK